MKIWKVTLLVLLAAALLGGCRQEVPTSGEPSLLSETAVPAPRSFPWKELKMVKLHAELLARSDVSCGDYFVLQRGGHPYGMVTFIMDRDGQGRGNLEIMMLGLDKLRTEITDKPYPTAEVVSTTPGGVLIRLSKADYDGAKDCLPPPGLVFGSEATAAKLGERPLRNLSELPIKLGQELRCGKYLVLVESKLICQVEAVSSEAGVVTFAFDLGKYTIMIDNSKKVPTAQAMMAEPRFDAKVKQILIRMSEKDYLEIRGCLPSQEFRVPPPRNPGSAAPTV